MDNIDLAKQLLKTSDAKPTQTTTITGVATSDSSDGYVMVDTLGTSTTQDDSQSISIPTTVTVKKNDIVMITLVGADGTAKSPTVTGVVGGGDRTQESVDKIQQRADSGEFDGVVIYINSSEGTAFKNNNINTVLSIVIYHGATEIKNQASLVSDFGTGAYLQWSIRKFGDTDFTIVSSSDSHLSDSGFKYTVGADDIDTQCVFNVQIITVD